MRSMHVNETRAAEALASGSSRGTDAQQIICARCMHVYKGRSSSPDQYKVASEAPAVGVYQCIFYTFLQSIHSWNGTVSK